jgi:hypothetical protein
MDNLPPSYLPPGRGKGINMINKIQSITPSTKNKHLNPESVPVLILSILLILSIDDSDGFLKHDVNPVH